MDSFLRQLERKAQAGDIDALWQAYYALKRTLPALTNQNLRDLANACSDELYNKRCFVFWFGSSDNKTYAVEIPEDGGNLEKAAIDYLNKYQHLRTWYQTPGGYVTWTPSKKLLYYRSEAYGNIVKPVPESQVSGEEIPKARHIYLVRLATNA